jgi:DNA-binding MarR family transcriptional regulator
MAKKKNILPGDILHMMDMAVRMSKQEIARVLQEADLGLTADQWFLLRIVMEHEGLNQKDLAKEAGKDHPTVTRMLELMVQKGWVVKEPTPGDRRSWLILPTLKGQKTYKKARKLVQGIWQYLLEKPSKKELRNVYKTCQSIVSANMSDRH